MNCHGSEPHSIQNAVSSDDLVTILNHNVFYYYFTDVCLGTQKDIYMTAV